MSHYTGMIYHIIQVQGHAITYAVSWHRHSYFVSLICISKLPQCVMRWNFLKKSSYFCLSSFIVQYWAPYYTLNFWAPYYTLNFWHVISWSSSFDVSISSLRDLDRSRASKLFCTRYCKKKKPGIWLTVALDRHSRSIQSGVRSRRQPQTLHPSSDNTHYAMSIIIIITRL